MLLFHSSTNLAQTIARTVVAATASSAVPPVFVRPQTAKDPSARASERASDRRRFRPFVAPPSLPPRIQFILLSHCPPQLQPRPSTNNLYKSGWSLVPEARRLSQLVVDSFRKSSKDGVQVTGVYQPMDDPAGSSASTPAAVSRGRKQSVHVYRQDSDKVLAAGKLADKLETVVDAPDGDEAAAGSRRQSAAAEQRQRRVGSVAAPPASDE